MKSMLKILSVLCGVVAIMALIVGVRVLFGHSYGTTFILFSLVRKGTFMGFLGNLIAVVFTVFGFGVMCYTGLTLESNKSSKRLAFIYGCIMTSLCLISLFCTVAGHSFNFGDIILLLLPAIYTFAVFKTA